MLLLRTDGNVCSKRLEIVLEVIVQETERAEHGTCGRMDGVRV